MNHTAEPVRLNVEGRTPRKLTAQEREHICSQVEAALNGGWDELRVYPHSGRIWTTPIKTGRRLAA